MRRAQVANTGRRVAGRAALAGLMLLALTCGLVAWKAAPIGNIHTGDTDLLVKGSGVANRCLAEGRFSRCGLVAPNFSEVGPYPLLQYLPSMALRASGASPETTMRLLARLNFAAVLLVFFLALVLFRRPRDAPHRWLAVVVLIAGPVWFYATTAFGEALSAVFLVLVVLGCHYRRWWLILGAAVLAGISKETTPAIVLALGVVTAYRSEDRWLLPRRVLVPLGAGVIAAFTVNLGFNLFRSGTLSNVNYTDPLLRVDSLGRLMWNYLLIWFSPNAGVLAFWPLLLVPAVMLVIAGIRSARVGDWPQLARVVMTVAIPPAAYLGLAAWYSPFGWIAWGPRLELPILPAWLLAALLVADRDVVADTTRALVRRGAAFAVTVVVVVASASFSVGAAWSHARAVEQLVKADHTCGRMTEVIIQKDVDEYYRCLLDYGFREPGKVHLETFRTAAKAGVLGQVLLSGGCVLLLVALRATVRRRVSDGHH